MISHIYSSTQSQNPSKDTDSATAPIAPNQLIQHANEILPFHNGDRIPH